MEPLRNSTTSFIILSGSNHGSMIINKSSSNSYSQIGQFKLNDTSACDCYGSLSSVSGVVDRLKISVSTGSFNAGLIGLSYKTSGSGGSSGDKISEGNTEAEVVDTGSDGHFKVTTEGTERLRITSNGSVGIGTTNPNVAVDSTNTAKLSVGIVTCNELYVNGNQITGNGGEPVGSIIAWAGTVATIPTGYQLCDGFEAQTPALAAITGTYVPDLRSRFIVGAHDVTGEGTCLVLVLVLLVVVLMLL